MPGARGFDRAASCRDQKIFVRDGHARDRQLAQPGEEVVFFRLQKSAHHSQLKMRVRIDETRQDGSLAKIMNRRIRKLRDDFSARPHADNF